MQSQRGRALAATFLAMSGALGLLVVGDLRSHAVLAAGGMVLWGLGILVLRPAWTNPIALLTAAVLVRLLLLGTQPTLSDDIFRYLWEGKVWANGFNPFRMAPDAPELSALHDEIWAQVNHREVSSVYPPLAQFLFFLVAPGGIFAWKLLMMLADVGTAWFLFRRRAAAGWTWALLPVCCVETAGSGHLEGVGVLLLVLGMGGSAVGAFLGSLVKMLPGVLLVRLVQVKWWWLPAVGGLLALAMLNAGETLVRGLETYRAFWTYNGSIYSFFHWLGVDDQMLRRGLQGIGLLTVAGILWRSRDPGRIALWTCGAFVMLSPTVHPWYLLWPLAAALWNGMEAWSLLAALVPLSYVVLATYDPVHSSWSESSWVRWVEYPPFYLFLAWEGWRRLTLPSPAPVH